MPHRIAIASSDGKFIDQHFGHANRFLVVDVDTNGYTVLEPRLCIPACNGSDHEANDFDSIAELLGDCEAVFVSRIGRPAAQHMSSRGIRVFEAPYFIEDVLKKIMNEQVLGAPQTNQ